MEKLWVYCSLYIDQLSGQPLYFIPALASVCHHVIIELKDAEVDRTFRLCVKPNTEITYKGGRKSV